VRRVPALLALPLVAAACGTSKAAHTAAEPPRLTQQQFVAAANAVCVASDRRVYRLGRLSLAPAGWAKTATAARLGLTQMEKLRPPAAQQAGFTHLLELGRQLAAGTRKVYDALVAKDYKTARAWQQKATVAETAIHRQARKLGLTFCQQLLTNWPA